MLKVCHFISGDLWAGAEAVAFHLLKALRERSDLTVSAILLNEGKLASEIRNLGIENHVVDEAGRSFPGVFWTTRRILGKGPPDIIHSHRYKENILAYLLSRAFGEVRLVATQHGMPEIYAGDVGMKNRFVSKANLSILSRCFDQVVAVSQDIKERFEDEYGFRRDKVSVIRNGIEIQDSPEKSRDDETFVIGSSGRLFPVKDYPLMVEIAREIRKRSNRFLFELAGDGPERQKIQTLLERYDLNGAFVLRGHLEKLSTFYQGLDLYLNTSIHEGLPISVLEAMACGLPVVAPNVGGIREIIDNEVEGYLVEERNPKAFAEKCFVLSEDKKLREKMSKAAAEKVKTAFSAEKMSSEYYNLYLKVVGNH